MKDNKKKTIILSVIAITIFAILVIGATYAYFTAQGGNATSAKLNVTTYTTDVFTFTTGDAISIYADQSSFASGKGNAVGSTFAKASLTANNKTNTATENYNVYFNISDNNFKYTVNSSTPELLLTIKDANNNEVTSISGLEHKTVTDAKGASISGFDITTKTGLLTLIDNREITASPSKEEQWNITITFVNYNSDQSSNMGKTFDGQVLISKDAFDEYNPNTINSVTATKSGSNLTVKLSMNNGTNEIDKYYFAITEKDSVAMLDTKVIKLSNKLAATTPTYVESTTNSYTFASIKDNANYEIYAYAVDKKKIKSNIYKYDLTTDNYSYPTINNVTTTSTSNSITVNVTATKGANNISKYYYSIDNGNSYVESTDNNYTFSNLTSGSNYRIIVKVSDTNNKYSNIYVVNEKIVSSSLISFVLDGAEFQAEENMSMAQWINSDYNIYGYYFIESCSSTDKSSCVENSQQNIVENGTYYIKSFFFGVANYLDINTVYVNDILVDAASEPAKSLQFSSLSYQSYYGPTEIISESYGIIKGDLSPIAGFNLSDYVFDFDAPFVLSNPEYEKGHNFENVSITFECSLLKFGMKGVKILHYSNLRNTWEVLIPSKIDFDNKIMGVNFSEISLGDPIMIIHK